MSKNTKETIFISLVVAFWLGMLVLYWPVALVFLVFGIAVFNLRDREEKDDQQREEDR